MFWGITCESGKRYSQIPVQSFHVSMAALEPKDKLPENKLVSLMLEHKGKEFLLCTLDYERMLQSSLNLSFNQGEEMFFFISGEGTIHLSGYLIGDYEIASPAVEAVQGCSYSNQALELEGANNAECEADASARHLLNMDYNSEDDEDWSPQQAPRRRSQRRVNFEEGTSEQEQFCSLDEDIEEDSYDEEDEDEDEDDDDDDEDDECEDDESSIETSSEEPSDRKRKKRAPSAHVSKRSKNEVSERSADDVIPTDSTSSKKKKLKSFKASDDIKLVGENVNMTNNSDDEMNSSIGRTPMPKKVVSFKDKLSKDPDSASKSNSSENACGSAQKKTPDKANKTDKEKSDSVEIHDMRIGRGPLAKNGKFVHVYYTGKLTNNQVFDSARPGSDQPLAFRLGRNEVIQGWDMGIQGMRVGGKRRLKIPPHLAYGKRGNGPVPPNSTLLFTIELKAVN